MVRRSLLLIIAFCGISRADTGFSSTIKVRETDGSPSCVVGQISVSPGTLTCAGQSATLTTGGGGGTPGGADTNVQFNDAGSFGGNSGFTYDKTNQKVSINPAAGSLGLQINPVSSFGLSNGIGIFPDGVGCDSEYIGGLLVATNGSTSCGFSASAGDVQLGSGFSNMWLNSYMFIPGTAGRIQFFTSISSITISDNASADKYALQVGTGSSNNSLTVSTTAVVQITSNTILGATTVYADGSMVVGGTETTKALYISSNNATFDQYILPTYVDKSTITWSNSNIQFSSMTANTTYVFNDPPHAANLTLIIWTSVGSHTATWPASVLWSGGTAPTITTAANKRDIIQFKYLPAVGPVPAAYVGTYVQNF